jgi:hypothetical protein
LYEKKYKSESGYGSGYGNDNRDGSGYGSDNRGESTYSYDSTDVIKYDSNGSAFGFSNTSDPTWLNNAIFYYGRVHSPDYQAVGVDFNATLFYEVYCRDCNRTGFPRIANARESVDSVYWYILTPNDFNNLLVGVRTPVYSRGQGVANMIRRNVIELQALQTPYTDRIIYQTDSWLRYNRFRNVTEHSFLIEHHSPVTTWSGKGKKGKKMEEEASKRKSEKMDW